MRSSAMNTCAVAGRTSGGTDGNDRDKKSLQ